MARSGRHRDRRGPALRRSAAKGDRAAARRREGPRGDRVSGGRSRFSTRAETTFRSSLRASRSGSPSRPLHRGVSVRTVRSGGNHAVGRVLQKRQNSTRATDCFSHVTLLDAAISDAPCTAVSGSLALTQRGPDARLRGRNRGHRIGSRLALTTLRPCDRHATTAATRGRDVPLTRGLLSASIVESERKQYVDRS